MFKKFKFVPASVSKYTWLITVACVLTLGASACQINLPENSLTPTPTPPTVLGFIPQGGQSTSTPEGQPGGAATETSASGEADPSDLADLVDVCALVTKAEAEAVLGMPVEHATPGVDDDGSSGGTLYFCSYLGSGIALVSSYVELDSAQAAKDEMKRQLAQNLADEPGTTSAPLAFLGDQATWSTSEHAGAVTVVSDNIVFSLLVGGNVGDPAAYKAALQALAATVLGRL
jgi:hypothetical protein